MQTYHTDNMQRQDKSSRVNICVIAGQMKSIGAWNQPQRLIQINNPIKMHNAIMEFINRAARSNVAESTTHELLPRPQVMLVDDCAC